MSRDHYRGPKKRVPALLNPDGDISKNQFGLPLGLDIGTATLPGAPAYVTITGSHIKESSVAFVSSHNNNGSPATALNWDTGDGFLTISGTGQGLVSYMIKV